MTLTTPRHYVASRWHEANMVPDTWICDANSGATLQPHVTISADLTEAAIASAHACHLKSAWACDPRARADALDRIAAYLEVPARREAISVGDSLTTGVVISVSRRMASMLPAVFKGAADVIREGYLSETVHGPCGPVEHFRQPWGPALLIAPWNAPTLITAHKLASALAAGAPALVKPSCWTPHSAVAIFEAIAACDLPEGAATLILGDRHRISPLVNDARVRSVSFTGGLSGGRAIGVACAPDFKAVQLELGGHNALVVLEGADLEVAASAIVYTLCTLNGQWCRALGRISVARALHKSLMERVLNKLAQITLGSSLDASSQMGPQAHQRQHNNVNQAIDRLQRFGGHVHQPTPLSQKEGYFVRPTLIDGCKPEDTLAEIFGPVAVIHCFDTEAEALTLAHAPPYGLAGYVFGPQPHALAFARKMKTGGVKVNGAGLLALNSDGPRAAWMLSGLGEEGRRETVRFLTGACVVGVSPQDDLGV